MYCARACWIRGGLAIAALLLLTGVASSQAVQARVFGQAGQQRLTYIGVPGMHMLGAANVQEELELVDDQKKKLQEIGKKYQQQMRGAWAGVRELPADQRQAKMAEIRAKTQKLAEQARKEAEGVLLAQQLDALKKIMFRQRAQYSLRNPRLQQEINLDEAQKAKLRELQTSLQEKMKKLNEETLDKALEVLTPEQRKKLEETTWQSARQGYSYGAVRAPAVKKTQ